MRDAVGRGKRDSAAGLCIGVANSIGQEPSTIWTDLPSSLLRDELARRQDRAERPQCGSGGGKKDYNLGLHVFALFLILILSTLACSFPLIVRRVPWLPVPQRFLFLSRHFGTGVLIATAFVHLLPTAFASLTDPCLPPFWTEGYPAMPGFIAMVSMMVVVGVEMFFATKGAGHSHSSEFSAAGPGQDQQQVPVTRSRPNHVRTGSLRRFKQGYIGRDGDQIEEHLQNANGNSAGSYKHKHSANAEDEDEEFDLEELDPHNPSSRFLLDNEERNSEDDAQDMDEEGEGQVHGSKLSEQQHQQKLLLQCLLLEAGILFHSVFIGMAVSVATGTSFIVLLVAISFHQTFEGLALGSRIAAITSFPRNSPKPWLMALAYGTTTPVGQAIGLLVHNLYDPQSQVGLLMVGIMNAISSGLLLFAGLVELLAEDLLSEHSYASLQGRKRLEACASVVAGAFLMALVGAWA